jgi:hypothetical protein
MHKCKYEGDRFGPIKCLIDWHETKADRYVRLENEERWAWHERKAAYLRRWLYDQTGELFLNPKEF